MRIVVLRRLLVLISLGLAIAVYLEARRGALLQAQAADEEGLTATHFRAPEFPEPEFSGSELEPLSTPNPAIGPGGQPGGINNPQRPAGPPTPGSADASGDVWINSPPLTMAKLRGKVALIDFWEYTCINCIRTFATNKTWYERYHKYGFEIIGVHDPEFDIAYPVDHVRAAVRRFELPYPVVVDDSFKIWKSYNNNTWPNRFLIDAQGVVRYNRSGEGADGALERAIQKLLKEAHRGLEFPASYTIAADENAFAPSCGNPTAEMYVGDWYGRGILANPEGYRKGKTIDYQLVGEPQDGKAELSGPWQTETNGMIYRGKRKKGESRDDKLEMRYHAREVYAVMSASRGRPSRLFIQQDGKDLAQQDKGVDVQADANGRTYIEVREARMYYLVQNPSFGEHTIILTPTAPGLTVNSFTFGNNCQTQFPHL